LGITRIPAPEPSVPPSEEAPTWGGDPVACADPIASPLPGQLTYPVPRRAWTAALPKAVQQVAILQPPFPSSFVHGWVAMKEPAAGMYWAATPPLTAEPSLS